MTVLIETTSPQGGGPCETWPVDLDCCKLPDGDHTALITKWAPVATGLLWAESGRIYGGCELTVRPCAKRCNDLLMTSFSGAWLPVLGSDGRWRNLLPCSCGAECACSDVCEIALDGVVSGVTQVYAGGEVLSASAYRLDRVGETYTIVRTDGACWPDCQDIAAADDEPGAFAITYVRGVPLSDAGVAAHSELVCELVKSCVPGCKDCRLPKNVQQKTRQGVSEVFKTDTSWLWTLPLVSAWLNTVNPKKLSRPLRVASPDARGPRVTS